jgi:hypothetical protein
LLHSRRIVDKLMSTKLLCFRIGGCYVC